MPLSPGDKLGPYEILAPIGAGGMGDVYKVRDARLDRIVAIKVSRTEFSERFEREARAVAALNHPNICQIYDVGPDYLVMEYIEGTPLKGPLPLDQALKYAVQICDALDAAHKKGITHRDLKPANILITKQGIKLLDFGLAKVGPAVKAQDATLTIPLTGKGEILGTLVYMSPEQLNGEEVGPRSDIFSFGLVLYEILTGKRAFDGKSQASVIAAILERPAPSVAGVAPPVLDRLLKKCLAKDPDNRWQSARDLKDELEWIAGESERADIGLREPSIQSNRKRWFWPSVAALFGLAALALGFVAYHHANEEPPRLVTMSVPAPTTMAFYRNGIPAISPDGRHVAFVVAKGNVVQLWVRDLDSPEGRLLPGTEGAYGPFWSPDSRFVAFFSADKLKKIDLAGGPSIALCDGVVSPRGGSWGKDNAIVFAPNLRGPLFRVSATGGRAQALTSIDTAANEASHRFPWFLPDGHHFLYTVATSNLEQGTIYFTDIEFAGRRALVQARSNAIYAAPGYLLFVRDQVLLAQPLNPEKGLLVGEPTPVAAPIDYQPIQIQGAFSASQNGTLVYRSAEVENSRLTWFGRDGVQTALLDAPGEIRSPALSPDGSTIALVLTDPQTNQKDIWLRNAASGQMTRFTFNGRTNDAPVWSHDGRQLVYRSTTGGGATIYRRPLDGSVPEIAVDPSRQDVSPSDVTPDGRYVIETNRGSNTRGEIWLVPLVPPGKPYPLLQARSAVADARVSPDGSWIAYVSTETGRNEVYVQAFPAGTAKRQVSIEGGSRARWSRDGRELYFIGLDGKLMAAEATRNGPSLDLGPPKSLFMAHIIDGASGYDVGKDGRFLIPVAIEQSGPPMTVILNWQAGLKK